MGLLSNLFDVLRFIIMVGTNYNTFDKFRELLELSDHFLTFLLDRWDTCNQLGKSLGSPDLLTRFEGIGQLL